MTSRFSVRQHVREHVVDPERGGDRLGGRLVVARQHDDAQAFTPQIARSPRRSSA